MRSEAHGLISAEKNNNQPNNTSGKATKPSRNIFPTRGRPTLQQTESISEPSRSDHMRSEAHGLTRAEKNNTSTKQYKWQDKQQELIQAY